MTIDVQVVMGYDFEAKAACYHPIVNIQSSADECLDPRKLLKLQAKIGNVIANGLADCRMKDEVTND